MLQTPLFSVLIANYNDGRYLMEAIDSVFAQHYKNWEIIIVDDCSTDNSKDIINTLNDSRIHVYLNDKNYGCGYTKRKCVELAHGEICGFVDADDSILPESLATMVEAHIHNPQCSLIYSQYFIADNKLNILGKSSHQHNIPSQESFLTHPGAISHFVSFKKHKYQQTAGINPDYRSAEDIDIYLKLEEVGKLLFIDKPLYIYRCGTDNNISQGKNGSRKSFYYEILARNEACRRRGVPVETHLFPIIDTYVDSTFNDGINEGEQRIRKTKAYRIGKKVISIFK